MAVTDLTNTRWRWNDTISYGDTLDNIFSVNFVSNNTSYVNMSISYSSMSSVINYYESGGLATMIQNNNDWRNEAYKDFKISGGDDATNPELIDFIVANAVEVIDTPVFKYVSGQWVRQDAFKYISGQWVRISNRA